MTLGAEVVRHRREAGLDDFGNPAAAGEPTSLTGCAVYPRGTSTEESGRQMTTIDGYTVLIPPAEAAKVQITPESEFEWARQPGVWRKAIGNPGLWPYLDGDLAAVQVNLRGETG